MEQQFYGKIKRILSEARNKVYQTANFAMVEAYWNIEKISWNSKAVRERLSMELANGRTIQTDDRRFWKGTYCCKYIFLFY